MLVPVGPQALPARRYARSMMAASRRAGPPCGLPAQAPAGLGVRLSGLAAAALALFALVLDVVDLVDKHALDVRWFRGR